MPTTLPRILSVQAFAKALIEAGIIPADGTVRRLVIDVDSDKPGVIMHLECYGDERMLEVVQALQGVEIREVDRPRPEPT